ncbi:carboxypeptidase-like regulatory domain-containing protein, partial [Klebsiella pneumoniae]|uniref:carboxypeptidase-like regulatory domain-containing protein n=1 Tax=Klebsiella pneumoniae TaxID=573 RepID=UPI003013BC68
LSKPVNAQSTTDGAIGGTVMDATGAAITGAKVTAKNNGTNASDSMTTDDNGSGISPPSKEGNSSDAYFAFACVVICCSSS